MSKRSNSFSPGLLVAAFVFFCSAAICLGAVGGRPSGRRAEGPEAKAAPQAAQAPAAAPVNEYVGQDMCLHCHAEFDDEGTLHASTSNPRTPASTRGCESCHGPGQGHADNAGGARVGGMDNPSKLPLQQANAGCTPCHNGLWSGSYHNAHKRNVGCLTCHSVHSPKGEKELKAPSEVELCGTCHPDPGYSQ